MFDLKKWSKNSPVKAWVTVIFTVVMAINGLVNGFIDIYMKASTLNEPKELLAVVERADFQNQKFDEVAISFRNPTGKDKSINNLSLRCSQHDGKEYVITAENNNPEHYSVLSKLQRTPIKVEKNGSVTVTAVFIKLGKLASINERCKSISPFWGDSAFNPKKGDNVNIPKGTVFFGQTIYKES